MARKPEWAIAGTMPGDHGLATIRKDIDVDPRLRRWAVIEFVAEDSKTHRPEDGEDEVTHVITVKTLEPVTGPDDVDQLRAIRDRARSQRPGQGSLDEAADNGPVDTSG